MLKMEDYRIFAAFRIRVCILVMAELTPYGKKSLSWVELTVNVLIWIQTRKITAVLKISFHFENIALNNYRKWCFKAVCFRNQRICGFSSVAQLHADWADSVICHQSCLFLFFFFYWESPCATFQAVLPELNDEDGNTWSEVPTTAQAVFGKLKKSCSLLLRRVQRKQMICLTSEQCSQAVAWSSVKPSQYKALLQHDILLREPLLCLWRLYAWLVSNIGRKCLVKMWLNN